MPLPRLQDQLAQLVAASSVSSTQSAFDQSNGPVIAHLCEWLEDLGFRWETQEVQPGKFNLLATLGQGTGGLILAGHTDTVPYDEHLWRSDPLRLTERDGRWYGLGSCDMKGFFPLVLETVRRLPSRQLREPLIILATCDEESSMSGARALAASGHPKARAALIGEPTGLKPIRLHKGVMMERVLIQGRSGHSSDPRLGASALEAMHDGMTALLRLRSEWQAEFNNPCFGVPGPTLNLGCIHGGDNPNRICGQCALEFDLRPLPGMRPETLRKRIGLELEAVARRHGVQIDYRPLFPEVPPFEEAADCELVQLMEKLTGTAAGAVAFGTEAPYLQRLGCETLILGPGDIDCAHQPDEYLDLNRVEPMLGLLHQLIGYYCGL